MGTTVEAQDARRDETPNESASFSSLARRLLGASKEQLATFEEGKKKGLIEVAPVHLPVDPPGDCNHYGWPIATMAGETIVVMHRRIPGHNPGGAGRPHEKMSYGVVLHSDDGGKTWSQPYDLRDCMKPEDRNRGGIVPLSHRAKFDKKNKSSEGYKVHLHAIGTTRDGGVVAINNHGVFRSDDKGRTWKHFSKALRDDTFPHQIINLGPRIVDHPRHGLLAFGNWFGEVNSYHKYSQQLVALGSRDGGTTWQVEEHSAGLPQYEPAVLLHNEKFLFVTRDQTKVRAHKQMNWSPGEKPEIIDTNLTNPRYVDTVDFSFNPVTKRFEIVRSERYRMELWLWSMDPADWQKGQWRRECRLLARNGAFYKEADGFHPASAVIDEKRGVQHIFIYTGHPHGPAGVFRITRTLETNKLSGFLKPPLKPKRRAVCRGHAASIEARGHATRRKLHQFLHRSDAGRRELTSLGLEVSDHVFDDLRQLNVDLGRVVAVDSGHQIRAFSDVDVILFTPLDPFVVAVTGPHSCTSAISMASRTCFSWYGFASSPGFPLRVTTPEYRMCVNLRWDPVPPGMSSNPASVKSWINCLIYFGIDLPLNR